MTLWGSRFSEAPDALLWDFTADPIDRRMLVDDVTGSLAHVAMLGQVELLAPEEVAVLTGGLRQILADAEAGVFVFVDETDEDVHTAVERRLGELVGDVAGKLHTGRSRNDQVALDIRLYLRRMALVRVRQLGAMIEALAAAAESVGEAVVASYTHLQQAQAVPLGHHLLAYAWMLKRDIERFGGLRARLDESPLGAGASAGSSLPLDADAGRDALGMATVFDNSMDAIGSRDQVAEYVFCCAQAMTHLSRLAEESIMWATEEYGWVTFADRHTTGSSSLPQKKNPDMAELVRGRAATVIGDMTSVLALQKGLPMTYNRDFQEDKRIVFHADDVLAGSLVAMAALIRDARFHPPAAGSWVTALDLAEVLVAAGVPFRQAHRDVGELVMTLVGEGRGLDAVTPQELAAANPGWSDITTEWLTPESSVERRRTHGGGSHRSVLTQLAALRHWLGQQV